MKNYTITVNGNTYDVVVEENAAGSAAPAAAPVAAAPKAAAPKAAAPKASAAAGSVKINAPMPGKILKVNVNNNAQVKKGQAIMVLEAMKMENEIVAPQDGTVASINVSVGQSVESGDLLASLN